MWPGGDGMETGNDVLGFHVPGSGQTMTHFHSTSSKREFFWFLLPPPAVETVF